MASRSKLKPKKQRKPEQRSGMVMRLHLVRGSFFSTDLDDDACPSMDAEVWNRLPEELMWEVVLRLPAAKHFQLQLVSRKWRQVLTSVHFRSRVMAAAAAVPRKWEQQQQQQRVVACACVPQRDARDARDSGSSSTRRGVSEKVKVVDIDLCGFVPDWFWFKWSDSYSVVAAGDGLVCISNDSEIHHFRGKEETKWWEEWEYWKPLTNQYCVVNPVTRTCIVLPKPPFRPRGWLPLTVDAVAIYTEWEVATYDLATSSGGGGWVSTAHYVEPDVPAIGPSKHLSLALCGGETYRFTLDEVHVLAPGPGGSLEYAAAPLDACPATLLGVDPSDLWFCKGSERVVAHGGAVFFLANNFPDFDDEFGHAFYGTPFAMWRLARHRMEWEPVTLLHDADVERLARLSSVQNCEILLHRVYGVGQLMCFQFQVRPAPALALGNSCGTSATFVLAFDLDAGQWELLHHDPAAYLKPHVPIRYLPDSLQIATPLELRPDLFLSLPD